MYGHHPFWLGLGELGAIITWILVIVGIFILVKWLTERGGGVGKQTPGEDSAHEILKRRYAKGEIDKEEFEQKKKDLTG
jgi:putative membrane protein